MKGCHIMGGKKTACGTTRIINIIYPTGKGVGKEGEPKRDENQKDCTNNGVLTNGTREDSNRTWEINHIRTRDFKFSFLPPLLRWINEMNTLWHWEQTRQRNNREREKKMGMCGSTAEILLLFLTLPLYCSLYNTVTSHTVLNKTWIGEYFFGK